MERNPTPASYSSKMRRTTGHGVGVGLERAELRPGGRFAAVGVGLSGVHEPVPVVGPPAEPASGGRQGEDRGAGAVLDAAPFGFGQPAEQAHDEIVGFAVGIDAPADLRDPQVDAVVAQHRERELELRAGERPLGFGDHQRVPAARRVGDVGEESAGFGASRPRDRAAHVDVVVDGHDAPAGRVR